MIIFLPALELTLYQKTGSKNIARQLLASKCSISLNISEENRFYLIIKENGSKICFTTKEEYIPEGIEYALLTNILPSKQRFEEGKIVIKGWAKHPFLKGYSPSEVRESWKNDFLYKEEDDEGPGLRQPQIAALHMIMGHLKLPLDAATIVMPTGTGKTETMLATLVANSCEKLLVTVPSDSLRNQIAAKFFNLGLLKQFGVVGEKSLYPIVGIIKNKFESTEDITEFLEKCNVVVTTMSWLTNQDNETQGLFARTFSHVFIDEAHHVKASSWNEFRNKFDKEKVIQFTATPFRNDGKRLDGKIISNFPLKKAQEQGYYKKIEFISIREYEKEKADQEIAKVAVERLRSDLANPNPYNHILMARCATKERAKEIFKLYEVHKDLNPVIIYSGALNFKKTYDKILQKKTRLIVCVDMLGEGFDLPELKIAAFHDIRKSLPITLQLAGRFTRTKYDEELGDASFIANIADLEVRAELADLYATDADWNEILSDASSEQVNEQVEFKDFMSGFKKLNNANIPFQNIRPKLSTVVYKNKTNTWNPGNFQKGISGYDNLEFKFHDTNREHNMLVIVTGKRFDVEWVHDKREIYDIQWDIIIVYWETKNNLLFINSSDNGSIYTELAQAIIGDNADIVKGIDVFRTFYNIKRVKLQNVGLRQFLGKNIRFRMMVGSDVGEALSLAEKQRGEKAFVMGTGFEVGNPVNIGASYKGRIWTKLQGDLKQFKNWCIALGNKLVDKNIDPNQILKETLIPDLRTNLPNLFPVWIDWDTDMYLDVETKYNFIIGRVKYDLSNIELCLVNPSIDGDLLFSLKSETQEAVFKLELFEEKDGDESFADFKITQQSKEPVEVQFGRAKIDGVTFFEKFIPTVWYANGSALTGNEYYELKQQIGIYPKHELISWNWDGVNLRNEAQGIQPKKVDSIQYKVIEQLKQGDFDIIYDDDYSGEIADVVTIKAHSDKIEIKLYHLKFALDGVVSNQIKNFYDVCGQAQKSVHWKHKSGKEFINHLLKRETKSKKGLSCSRLEKGNRNDLVKLMGILKNEIPVEYEILIVQPGLSKAKASDDILTLLGVTATYIKEFADINLKIITSR
ncbi:Superfamily II DNA or RNA helicase [Arachidicoccus rhizosphaerae]|uniref:Superfamily II DNA or RNA helicase n=1 Tax=Arachidicoccus rhizosphaerae TaxID=551991 RepID=A0A1H3YRI1_9BACT|nr:DEAD/DEAH box helicase family protein [Arachidicoccus rhizosphaerae]SEA14149.1 Superfamily II DNA or RNA helicase [Arachidicoccus rhizosphaerae]